MAYYKPSVNYYGQMPSSYDLPGGNKELVRFACGHEFYVFVRDERHRRWLETRPCYRCQQDERSAPVVIIAIDRMRVCIDVLFAYSMRDVLQGLGFKFVGDRKTKGILNPITGRRYSGNTIILSMFTPESIARGVVQFLKKRVANDGWRVVEIRDENEARQRCDERMVQLQHMAHSSRAVDADGTI